MKQNFSFSRGLIATTLAATLFSTTFTTAIASNITLFDDVPETHWAHSYIMMMEREGVVYGIRVPDTDGTGSYNPSGTVSLGEFLAMATRIVCSDYINLDEATDFWATPYYTAAVKSGLISSADFQGAKTRLEAPISREDMAHILVNFCDMSGETLTVSNQAENQIGDYYSISLNRRDSVLKAYSAGLLKGYDNGNFGPKDALTRDAVAIVFCSATNLIERDPLPSTAESDVSSSGSLSSSSSSGSITLDETYFDVNDGRLLADFCMENGKEFFTSTTLGANSDGTLIINSNFPTLPTAVIEAGFQYKLSISAFDTYQNHILTYTNYFTSGDEIADFVPYHNYKPGTGIEIPVSNIAYIDCTLQLVDENNLHTTAIRVFSGRQDELLYMNHTFSDYAALTWDCSHVFADLSQLK